MARNAARKSGRISGTNQGLMPPIKTDTQESRIDGTDSQAERTDLGNSSAPPEPEVAVRQELKRILSSRYFRTASRSRQFLEFVVEHRLNGQADQLKERTIGTEVFQRPPGYATGEDPVVRVQAGEVRRRLEQFYQKEGAGSTLRIELPVGSYCPEFQSNRNTPPSLEPEALPLPVPVQAAKRHPVWKNRYVIAGVAIFLLAVSLFFSFRTTHQESTLNQFWAPVFSTPQPALICLAKGVTYRPSLELYDRYRSDHPGRFKTEVERSNDPLPLDPNQTLQWRDLRLFSDYGVATGDVYAAIRISGTLGQLRKPAQLRIGSDFTFQDLRNSPAVIVGAFNNKWTMNLTSNLHFAFFEQEGGFVIREQVPNGKTWPLPEEHGAIWPAPLPGQEPPGPTMDYAIAGRITDSKTGQFTVIAAGLTGAGTEAAGEFISSPELLERAFRDAPANWTKNNSLFVLKTTITDAVSGPPTVVASYFW